MCVSGFLLCVIVHFVRCGECLCGFCNVWFCVCVGFVMSECLYLGFVKLVYVCVGFVLCGCAYVWIL